ncbi:MAG: M23 family metallopeptidase, partial [Proteobacteria bacterium]|nr:M23 family metallopeptidase [Pseudomonadota bacterium]
MQKVLEVASGILGRWFHKRNIIIISERKVKHIPISGRLQFLFMSVFSVGVIWASYSTGSYIAARSALKEQGQALRNVTNAHIENSFVGYKPQQVVESAPPPVDVGPYKRVVSPVMNGAAAALSTLDNAKLFARIALLESKVIELKSTNEAIVQRVHDKTNGRLDNLEAIVKQTGLNLSELKRLRSSDKSRNAEARHNEEPAGGPYIPDAAISLPPQAKDMFTSLDELAVISDIVEELPLAAPLKDYNEHSGFGHRIDPFNGHLAFHSGIDLSGPSGARIVSTAAGKVVDAGRNGAYGNSVDIDHGYGIVTRYGHLSEILVELGQKVKKGETIGIQGSTG